MHCQAWDLVRVSQIPCFSKTWRVKAAGSACCITPTLHTSLVNSQPHSLQEGEEKIPACSLAHPPSRWLDLPLV